jgi:hypothetical protein
LLACAALLLQLDAQAADACAHARPGPNHVTVMSGGQKHPSVEIVATAVVLDFFSRH